MEREFLFLPGVSLAIFLTKPSNISKLLAMFWHLCICISLFVQTNIAFTCMFICQTNMDVPIDTWNIFFKKNICKLRACTNELPIFTNKLYKLVVL